MKTYFAFTQMFKDYSVCIAIVQADTLEEAVGKINKKETNVWDNDFLVRDFNYSPKKDLQNGQYVNTQKGISGEEFIETKTEDLYYWIKFEANLPDGYEFYYSHSG